MVTALLATETDVTCTPSIFTADVNRSPFSFWLEKSLAKTRSPISQHTDRVWHCNSAPYPSTVERRFCWKIVA